MDIVSMDRPSWRNDDTWDNEQWKRATALLCLPLSLESHIAERSE